MKSSLIPCTVFGEYYIQTFLVQELTQFKNIDVVAIAQQIDEAFHAIIQHKPDALLLDIKIIGGDAFQLINRLKKVGYDIPPIALSTGFPEYAVEAINDYRKYIIKYLTKPLESDWQERLKNIVDEFWLLKNEAQQTLENTKITDKTRESIFVSCEGNYVHIYIDDILWLEAAGSGASYIVTNNVDYKTENSLSTMCKLLPSHFYQISRINIININKIKHINKSEREIIIQKQGKLKSLSIGDKYYNSLLQELGIKSQGK